MRERREYTRTIVCIATADGIRYRDGYNTGVPGLVVHRSKPVGGNGWTVTHAESGYAIMRAATKAEAVELARAIGRHGNFTKPRETLQRNKRLIGRLRAIQADRMLAPLRGGKGGA